jgi:hypothetical protein
VARLSINELAELTGKDRRTIASRLADLPKVDGEKPNSFAYDSKQALELIFEVSGKTIDEARKEDYIQRAALSKAKREELDRPRIPIEIPLQATDQALQSLTAQLKAAEGKTLTEQLINAILEEFRQIPDKIKW